MAETKQSKISAEILFVEQGKNQKEIHLLTKISENTISRWAKAGNWKAKRDALMNTPAKRAEDIKTVIGTLTERRIEITKELTKARKDGENSIVAILQKEAVNVGQEVAMYSKALEVMDKSNKPTLSLYLQIMGEIFKSLNKYNSPLYLKTIDFQEYHLGEITEKLA